MSVQYRLSGPKGTPDKVAGDDGAELVVTMPAADAALDPTVAFMQGKLKSTGSTGRLFEVLSSGEAAKSIADLAG